MKTQSKTTRHWHIRQTPRGMSPVRQHPMGYWGTGRRAGSSKSSAGIHQLRQRVMNHLYRARELSGMCVPWIQVRILPLGSKETGKIAGQTYLGIDSKNVMRISEDMTGWDERTLKEVVFHELAHKYLGKTHAKTGLMSPTLTGLTEDQIESDFVQIAKSCKKK